MSSRVSILNREAADVPPAPDDLGATGRYGDLGAKQDIKRNQFA